MINCRKISDRRLRACIKLYLYCILHPNNFVDIKGEVLMAVSKKELAVTNSYEVELLAVLRGMQFCLPMGIHELEIECDTLLMVQDIRAPTSSSSLMGHILQDVKQLMKRVSKCSI